MMQKTIDYTFKMLYVLAIIMIVDGHIGRYNYLDLNGLLSYQDFHIGLFIFTSGYFLNLKRDFKDFFITKFSKLIIPLYAWNLFYGILCQYLNRYHGFSLGGPLSAYNLLIAPLTDGHQYIYNMASWFIIPLFLTQTISFTILKPYAKKDGTIPSYYSLIFFIFSLILGALALHFAPQNTGTRNFALMTWRTLFFLPVYGFGYLYRQILIKYDKLNTPTYLFILLSIIALLNYFYPNYHIIPSWLDSTPAPIIVIYTACFISILFWVRISKTMTPLIKESRIMQYIADHTFDIMMHHFIGFMIIKSLFQGFKDFDMLKYKTDIWYYYFPSWEPLTEWLYISITLVIGLLIGFTSRYFYGTIRQFRGEKHYKKIN